MKVGLTGGIGSGKSFVARVFQTYGIPVYDADKRAKYLMHHSEAIKESLIETFGKEVYRENQLDTAYLAELVFNDKNQLQKINAIVHPEVAKDYRNWHSFWEKYRPFTLKEAAIMIESGSYQELDHVIVISVEQKKAYERAAQRDGVDMAKVKQRASNQMPLSEKLKYADSVIDNNENKSLLAQVNEIYHILLQQKKAIFK